MGNSYHPKATFKSILTGENNRILRNCSMEADYIQTMDMLKDKFSQLMFWTNQLFHMQKEQADLEEGNQVPKTQH